MFTRKDIIEIFSGLTFLTLMLVIIINSSYIGQFFSSIDANGWIGFIGSVISVVGAFYVASHHYKKQSNDLFISELESTRRRIELDNKKINSINDTFKIVNRVDKIFNQKAKSPLISHVIENAHLSAKSLKERLQDLDNYHTYVMNDVENLKQDANQLEFHINMIKKLYSRLGDSDYGAQDKDFFEISLEGANKQLNLINIKSADIINKINK